MSEKAGIDHAAKNSYCSPDRAITQYNRWRALLGNSIGGDPGTILDRPDRRLTMLKIFGDTKRLADLCLIYPRTAAIALTDGACTILAQTARQVTSLDWGIGNPDAIHTALTPLKDRADLAISIAILSGEWDIHKAAAARTDLAERICEAILSWLMRAAVKRGELRLEAKDDEQQSSLFKGLFILAGGEFAHEDISATGPLNLVTVYDPAVFNTKLPNSNDRALIRIGAEFRDAIEGRPSSYPLYRLDTPFGSKLNGAGLIETAPSIKKIISAPQAEVLRNWLATARVVAGDRTSGGHFMEDIETVVWNEKPLLTREMTEKLQSSDGTLAGIFQSISQLCRLTMGRTRPLFRTASTQDVIATAAASKIISEMTASRLIGGHELAKILDASSQMVCGSDISLKTFRPESEENNQSSIGDHVANIAGFSNTKALAPVVHGFMADAQNALNQLLFGPRDSFKRYSNQNKEQTDSGKLENLGFFDGTYISSIIETWLSTSCPAVEKSALTETPQRFATRAPGLLTAFSETQYPNQAIKLFDQLLTNCPEKFDLYTILGEKSSEREQIVNAFGNFPNVITPLITTTYKAQNFIEDVIANDDKREISISDWLSAHPAPKTGPIKELSAWRMSAIAQIAFSCAAGLSDFSEATPLLIDIHHQTLISLFTLLKNGAHSTNKKLIESLVLFTCTGEWQSVPGDTAAIGFILTRKKITSEIEEKITRFVEDFVAELEKIGTGPFALSVDMSRRPGGISGPLVSTLPAWEQFVQMEAVAMDQIALANTRILTGSKTASNSARTTLREVIANDRRTSITLRDLDRARTQHQKRTTNNLGKTSSLWDIDHLDGGQRDIDLIIKILMYRYSAAHPYLQEMETEAALAALADMDIIDPETVTTLINARKFWASINLVKAWSGWSTPEMVPVRKRFSTVIARATGVTSFSNIPPLIRGYADDGSRLYAKLVLNRNDQLNKFASAV